MSRPPSSIKQFLVGSSTNNGSSTLSSNLSRKGKALWFYVDFQGFRILKRKLQYILCIHDPICRSHSMRTTVDLATALSRHNCSRGDGRQDAPNDPTDCVSRSAPCVPGIPTEMTNSRCSDPTQSHLCTLTATSNI